MAMLRMTALNILLLAIHTYHVAFSCENVRFRLKREPHAGFLCSPSVTQVNGLSDLHNLLNGENVAGIYSRHQKESTGIYRRHQKEVQVCYWKELPGLVSQASLSGGDMYTSGE